jgi:hypothetical protein
VYSFRTLSIAIERWKASIVAGKAILSTPSSRIRSPEVQAAAARFDDLRVRRNRQRAPAQRIDPRQQLSSAKRLGHVVVRPGAQAPNLLLFGAARGEHQHRQMGTCQTELAADLDPVPARQHEVQDDEVEVLTDRPRLGRASVAFGLHGVAGPPQ